MIAENIQNIKHKIAIAAQNAGRSPDDIHLLAVTKTMPPEDVEQAIEAGITHIAENYVQEFRDKYPLVKNRALATWHFIGHLQSNKIKTIIQMTNLIHSVDRLKLAQEINTQAAKIGKVQDILLQVNISGEQSKEGMQASDVKQMLEQMKDFQHIRVRGLMTMAPMTQNSEIIRTVFQDLKQLSIDLQPFCCDNSSMVFLSMGMTGDFEIAIAEGANMIRVGTAIFGKRT